MHVLTGEENCHMHLVFIWVVSNVPLKGMHIWVRGREAGTTAYLSIQACAKLVSCTNFLDGWKYRWVKMLLGAQHAYLFANCQWMLLTTIVELSNWDRPMAHKAQNIYCSIN
jgi:hypothetical protein